MKYISGWKCDNCSAVSRERPWNCPNCEKEICDNCGWMFGHCKPCSEGKTELELATAANATGNFDFEIDGLPKTPSADGAKKSEAKP